MNQPKASVELRLNNVIYRCIIENKFYNNEETPAYSVSGIANIVPNSAGQLTVALQPVIVCENCYKDKQWKFKDPSKIVVPDSKTPNLKDLVEKGVN